MTSRQRDQITAVAALAGAIAVFLPFVSWGMDGGTQDATLYVPIPFVVHLPLALLGCVAVARLAGGRAPLPLGIPDRGLAAVVAVYGLLTYTSMLLMSGMYTEPASPGIGFLLTAAACAVILGVAWMPDRGAVAAPASTGAVRPGMALASTAAFSPRWVAVAEELELPDGQRLHPETWYLAVARATDGLVVRLDDGSEAIVEDGALLAGSGA